MTLPDNESIRQVTLALPDGTEATITIKAMSVVVVPVPPRPRKPGEVYMLQSVTPEANLEISVSLERL
ncbi:MAG: hypothetical protein ABS41_12245 [Arenimonas sp. SCN 70-307]|uniref:hypothetical protein n=1 Tax=Arenimonas sp. SCN 70-307 TaxID=1660089 RepID=UPI00086D04C3|nr:hypothetical protein [Arenimonas sp. SCN 70-307]ODS61748.1 MAG: hypothetical protein ABS41_12245 [Arenimonas sp. SCN 70-307]